MKRFFLSVGVAIALTVSLLGCAVNDTDYVVSNTVGVDYDGEIIEDEAEDSTGLDLRCLNKTEYVDGRMCDVLNINLYYLLNVWWNNEKPEALINQTGIATDLLDETQLAQIDRSRESFVNWRNTDELYLVVNPNRGYTENSIRPLSHVCDVVTVGILGDYYDEKVVGISKHDARQMVIKLISASTKSYENDEWGCTWQSALWAENIGFSAWLLWDDLSEKDKQAVEFMIITEANNILNNYDIPYYKDINGNEICYGDTKGEEIAWNLKIFALASCMFPDNENVPLWEDKLVKMILAATSSPQDLNSDEVVDGVVLAEFLQGTNVHEDGTVINHGLYHVDYMTTIIEELMQVYLIYGIAGKEPLDSLKHNIDLIYQGLVEVDLGIYDINKEGSHFYQRDENGRATAITDMPGDNDWGGHWYANYYLTDVYVMALGLDANLSEELKADKWAAKHFEEILRMVYREEGNFFIAGENNFVSGEMFQMHNLVKAYMLINLMKYDTENSVEGEGYCPT